MNQESYPQRSGLAKGTVDSDGLATARSQTEVLGARGWFLITPWRCSGNRPRCWQSCRRDDGTTPSVERFAGNVVHVE